MFNYKKKKEKTVQFAFRVPEDLAKKIKRSAKKHNLTWTEIINQRLEKSFVEHPDK